MTRTVPFLPQDAIEHDAMALLTDFERARGVRLVPPIPLEDIVEKHLKLRIEFDDMHARHNVPRPLNGQTDILGAIYGDGSIFIDESLDPEECPKTEGRYRFTLAHELGHHRLHKTVFAAGDTGASVQIHPRVEWQANYFSSCFLMPLTMVCEAWLLTFGSLRPWVFQWTYGDPRQQPPPGRFYQKTVTVLRDDEEEEMMAYFNLISRPFARYFCVSVEAARIRLESLGLLRREGILRPPERVS